MKYSTVQYAESLIAALAGKPERKRKVIIRRFLAILRKNRDMRRLDFILASAERQWLKERGLAKVAIASASPLNKSVRDEIVKVLDRKAITAQSVEPQLLAGIRILIDDDLLIDASARRALSRLFARA